MRGASDWRPLPPAALQDRLLLHERDDEVSELFRPAHDLAFSRIIGRFSEEGARAITAALERSFVVGSFHMFADWSGMTSYESAARRVITDWAVEHRAQILKSYFCATNRLVEMGISVGAMAASLVGVEAVIVDYPNWLTQLESMLER